MSDEENKVDQAPEATPESTDQAAPEQTPAAEETQAAA